TDPHLQAVVAARNELTRAQRAFAQAAEAAPAYQDKLEATKQRTKLASDWLQQTKYPGTAFPKPEHVVPPQHGGPPTAGGAVTPVGGPEGPHGPGDGRTPAAPEAAHTQRQRQLEVAKARADAFGLVEKVRSYEQRLSRLDPLSPEFQVAMRELEHEVTQANES